jgi:TonB-linked SusC/RagA family outer membrane protein
MKRHLLFSLALVLSVLTVFAQERTVSGRVTSKEDAVGLPGVNVVLKGTTSGTVTDANGNYTLSAPASGGILVFSFIGLKSEEVEIGSRSAIDLQMETDVTQLTEIVVTETGYTQEKKFPGSAVHLGKDVSMNRPMVSIDQSLQGRAAGVLVNSGSGQPGSSANVRIRGVSSITGAFSQPLYVIDGVPVLGSLGALNSNDIESITILKDGAGGALYGARGANGVIVINTKKGGYGEKSIEFRTQIGRSIRPVPTNFNMMNTEEALRYEEMVGMNGFTGITGPGWVYSPNNPAYNVWNSSAYPAGLAAQQADYDARLAGFRDNNIDFYDKLFQNGQSVTNELVMRGGTESGRYFVSFNALDQEGFAKNSDYKRYTGRVNIDQKMIDKLTLNLNATIVSGESNSSVGDWLGNSPGNPFQIVWRAKPYEPVYKADGTLDWGTSTATAPKNIANAIERVGNSIYRQRDLRIVGALALKYEIIDGLSIRNSFGTDMNVAQGMYSINPDSYVGSLQTNNSGYHTEAIRNSSQTINTSSINFSKLINEKHEVEVGAYFEAIHVRNNGFGYQLFNLDKRMNETGQGAGALPTGGAPTYTQNGSGAKSEYGIVSYFGTARYTYNDKYTVNFNARQDGTSRILNETNKHIFTFSAGLAWDASQEDFLKSQNIVTDLKVRATYGEVPNIGSIQTNSYGMPGGFFTIPNYLGSQLSTFANSTAFAGSTITGQVPTTPGNPNLKIETVQKFNVGFDVGILNKGTLAVDLYKNVTHDLFVSKPQGATTGFGGTTLPLNAGQMTNQGIEMTLNVDIYNRGKWGITANANHAINKNTIDDLGGLDPYPTGTFFIKEGLPYGSHYTLDYIGADPATGQPRYRRASDGEITFSQTDAGQVANFGTFLPKHVGGFGLNARYGKIQLSTFFTYQFDVVRSNNVWSWVVRGIPGYANAVNQSADLLTQQWMQPGDEKFYQSPAYDRGFTSADLMDAKFLRFRELTISYTLPKIKYFKSVNVYARGQNIMIWSPWKGLDPEDDNNISLNEYPNPRQFVVGLELSL